MKVTQPTLAVVLVLCTLCIVSSAVAAEQRPNIVFIVADDLGYGELGCYGGKEIPTPHIDALAAGGARFTSGYVTAPFCAASRAALMTGRYQTRFGFEFNPIGAKNAAPGIGLPVAEKTVADRLRDSGYATALVGKWHLGGTAEFHPQRRGFDEFYGFLHEGHYYVPAPWQGVTTWLRRKTLPDGGKGRWTSPDGRIVWSTHLGGNEHEYDTDNPLLRSSQPIDEKANLTDAFTREACDFVGRHRAQPFFLYLSYNAVHSPMQGADAYMKKFAHIEDVHRRIFAAMLSHLDDSVGKVLAQLREIGVEDNTLVVFLSDNGGPTKELTSSNAPLSGGKGELREGGIRVPFVISWKHHVAAGRVIDTPIASIDVTATAIALARAEAASGTRRLDGIGLMPLLADNATPMPPRPLFWRVGKKNALRVGDWKLIRDGKDWQLYDLARDIGETADLAAKEPARVQQMSALWDAWNAEQVEPLWR
ncbi:sulfatase-like hydrolase/transferase [Humisphaera borealis]|uniref:Sulfatase-like hydrolase/transferase n=1 Tax=Humisphaera borealis TaxID=2807512 RepID=A0A7M2X0Q3_9BACT|nr:sulfatase-like hydrolase/transferase [Humisphaera borealis]QOV91328.1 sulfatase-like hydrolase/transferase [Humisphaera borealis]